MKTWIAKAERIARVAHAGQIDKAGAPYILHPERVARIVAGIIPDPEAVAAAWLHDVLEDTSVTSADLREEGIPEDVIRVVELMTHAPGVPVEDYVRALRDDRLARAVKAADLIDNSSPARFDALPAPLQERLRAKYHKMWEVLLT
ncbi:MAG: HD domain-containing protein [Corynebacterium sp.]|nr:HD domain-containing protein [Corynebacterium sp.]